MSNKIGSNEWVRKINAGWNPPGSIPAAESTGLVITLEELAKHNTAADAWVAIKGKVFNVTPFLRVHPGGQAQLLRGAGE
jgi:cytochrome-b5 reductase